MARKRIRLAILVTLVLTACYSPDLTPDPDGTTDGNGDVTVYVTRTGSKYHRGDCRYLRQSKIAISLEDAVAQGYTPCSVCDPPILQAANPSEESQSCVAMWAEWPPPAA